MKLSVTFVCPILVESWWNNDGSPVIDAWVLNCSPCPHLQTTLSLSPAELSAGEMPSSQPVRLYLVAISTFYLSMCDVFFSMSLWHGHPPFALDSTSWLSPRVKSALATAVRAAVKRWKNPFASFALRFNHTKSRLFRFEKPKVGIYWRLCDDPPNLQKEIGFSPTA